VELNTSAVGDGDALHDEFVLRDDLLADAADLAISRPAPNPSGYEGVARLLRTKHLF
jgi:hypothetical protein